MSGYKGVTTRDLQNVAPKVDKKIVKIGWGEKHHIVAELRLLQGCHFCGFWSKVFKA